MGKALNIIFMGTPDFAVASLDAIVHKTKHHVVAVITAPDKKAGRGKKIQSSAVKDYAFKHNLLILQPENLKEESFVDRVKRLNADIMVVVAFRMLPEVIWDMPKYGTFNLHASLLPQYRGAAPINHAILNGEKKSGITTFFLDKEIDTGRIILQEEVSIANNDTAGDLHDKLMIQGAKLVAKTLDLISDSEVQGQKQEELIQDETLLKKAPKIFKHHCQIDWNQSIEYVYNHIRGMSPYPTAFTILVDEHKQEHFLKLFKATYKKKEGCVPGKVSVNSEGKLSIQARDGELSIEELQLQGKKRMASQDFLRGFSIHDNCFVKSPVSLA